MRLKLTSPTLCLLIFASFFLGSLILLGPVSATGNSVWEGMPNQVVQLGDWFNFGFSSFTTSGVNSTTVDVQPGGVVELSEFGMPDIRITKGDYRVVSDYNLGQRTIPIETENGSTVQQEVFMREVTVEFILNVKTDEDDNYITADPIVRQFELMRMDYEYFPGAFVNKYNTYLHFDDLVLEEGWYTKMRQTAEGTVNIWMAVNPVFTFPKSIASRDGDYIYQSQWAGVTKLYAGSYDRGLSGEHEIDVILSEIPQSDTVPVSISGTEVDTRPHYIQFVDLGPVDTYGPAFENEPEGASIDIYSSSKTDIYYTTVFDQKMHSSDLTGAFGSIYFRLAPATDIYKGTHQWSNVHVYYSTDINIFSLTAGEKIITPGMPPASKFKSEPITYGLTVANSWIQQKFYARVLVASLYEYVPYISDPVVPPIKPPNGETDNATAGVIPGGTLEEEREFQLMQDITIIIIIIIVVVVATVAGIAGYLLYRKFKKPGAGGKGVTQTFYIGGQPAQTTRSPRPRDPDKELEKSILKKMKYHER